MNGEEWEHNKWNWNSEYCFNKNEQKKGVDKSEKFFVFESKYSKCRLYENVSSFSPIQIKNPEMIEMWLVNIYMIYLMHSDAILRINGETLKCHGCCSMNTSILAHHVAHNWCNATKSAKLLCIFAIWSAACDCRSQILTKRIVISKYFCDKRNRK